MWTNSNILIVKLLIGILELSCYTYELILVYSHKLVYMGNDQSVGRI